MAITPTQKYCSRKCALWMRSLGRTTDYESPLAKDTLCWTCKKATGGGDCPWANHFKPVDGWDATPTYIKTVGKVEPSYIVNECPLFERDKR